MERGFPVHTKRAAALLPHHASPLPPEASSIHKAKTPQLLPLDRCKKQHSLPHKPGPESQGLLCPYAFMQLTELLQRHSVLTLTRPPTTQKEKELGIAPSH